MKGPFSIWAFFGLTIWIDVLTHLIYRFKKRNQRIDPYQPVREVSVIIPAHGDLLYLDETTAGGLVASASAPDTTGDCVQPIGRFVDQGTDTYLCINVNHVSGWATVP